MNSTLVPTLLWLLAVLLMGLTGYVHYRYAINNYPSSRSWNWLLFFTGFTTGIIESTALFLPSGATPRTMIIFILMGGVVLGLISRFLLIQKMKTIVPPRDDV
ncbi:hypothetical protein KC887_07630 [Candidatus Kaiserbacteria bacterium]|nr:hypothetical protein [Candidatus Kaiserbacteria bacterium]